MEPVELGRWVLAIGKHLKVYAESPQLASLYATRHSARDGDLLLRLRRLGSIGAERFHALALDVGIAPQELPTVFQKLEQTELVSARQTHAGKLEGVEERILTEQEVYRGIAHLFELYEPSPAERALAPLLDLLSRLPLKEDEVVDRLCKRGLEEEAVRHALELQEAFGLLRRCHVGDFGTALLYNEYLWGHKIKQIGDILLGLPWTMTEALLCLIDEVRSDQGRPLDQLTAAPQHVIQMAARTGIIDTTTILTSTGDQKTFTFSPHFYGYRAGDSVSMIGDHADQVKLFVASIAYGTHHSVDFRLRSPQQFVRKLLREGEAGDAKPILRDYPLLEKQGIVVVQERSPGRGTFILKKRDVVELALDVMERGSILTDSPGENNTKTFVTQTQFRSPEANRLKAEFARAPGETAGFDATLLAAVREEAQKGVWE